MVSVWSWSWSWKCSDNTEREGSDNRDLKSRVPGGSISLQSKHKKKSDGVARITNRAAKKALADIGVVSRKLARGVSLEDDMTLIEGVPDIEEEDEFVWSFENDRVAAFGDKLKDSNRERLEFVHQINSLVNYGKNVQ